MSKPRRHYRMAKKVAPNKKATWAELSRLIRVKRCLETTGFPFVGVCVTCGKRFHIAALQAGHCFAGRKNVALLCTKFIDCQCVICNETHHGRAKRYERIIRERYGDNFVDRQLPRLHRVIADRDIDWAGRKARYRRRQVALLKKHGHSNYTEMLQSTRN